jgi:hypothetical protein
MRNIRYDLFMTLIFELFYLSFQRRICLSVRTGNLSPIVQLPISSSGAEGKNKSNHVTFLHIGFHDFAQRTIIPELTNIVVGNES